jgi:hypothetical protein
MTVKNRKMVICPTAGCRGQASSLKLIKLTGGKAVKASQAICNPGAKHANPEGRIVFEVVDADEDAEFILIRRMGKKADEARARQV